MLHRILPFAILAALAACAPFPRAEYAPAPPLPSPAVSAPVMLGAVKYRLPTGAEIGSFRENFCGLDSPVDRTELGDAVVAPDLRDAFESALSGEGFDVAGSSGILFDEEAENDMMRAEYRVGAEIVGADSDVCYQAPGRVFELFPQRPGFSGRLHLVVRWHVFDNLRRATVYRTQTEGYARRAVPNREGLSLLLSGAFGMAAHNLGADPAFRALLTRGIRPALPPKPQDSAPRRFDPGETFSLAALPLSAEPFPDHADSARRAAVLVQGGAGHGSGVFITGRGDILTNAHVTGDALHVRIVTADRKRALVGEVVRKDRIRDVALIRLLDPPDFPVTVLPVRLDWPKVGQRVYAVGSPLQAKLQDSVTSGIVSAWRKDYFMFGARQDFIQSDVTIQGGNSGGPLLDENGNLAALAVAGQDMGAGNTGLNYFIPVGEALKALGIEVK